MAGSITFLTYLMNTSVDARFETARLAARHSNRRLCFNGSPAVILSATKPCERCSFCSLPFSVVAFCGIDTRH